LPKLRSRSIFVPATAEIAELIVAGVSVAGIAAREDPTAKRSRPEMAPQRLEKIKPRPEMVWARKPRTHKIWYPGGRLTVRGSRLTNRKNDKVAEKGA